MRIKRFLNNLILPFILSIVVAVIYLAYFFTIGISKTQARNYYNLAVENLEEGNEEEARENLDKALEYWPEGYISDKRATLN